MADPIPATNPTVTPAVSSVTYDKWWMKSLSIDGDPNNTNKFTANVVLMKAYVDNTGTYVVATRAPDTVVRIPISDLYALIPTFPQVGTAVNAVVTAIVAYAQSKNLL